MNTIKSNITDAQSVFRLAHQLLRYVSFFLKALLCPKAVLAARLLAAESQLV